MPLHRVGDQKGGANIIRERQKFEPTDPLRVEQLLADESFAGHVADHTLVSNLKFGVDAVLQPVQFAARRMPVDPWLLGMYLGDGHFSSVVIASSESDIQARIRVTNGPRDQCVLPQRNSTEAHLARSQVDRFQSGA